MIAQKLKEIKKSSSASTLHGAARRGDIPAIEHFLAQGADINQLSSTGKSALIWAASYGHKSAVEFLLEKKADIDLLSQQDRTALMHATFYGHADIVEVLLLKGACHAKKTKVGGTALMYACVSPRDDLVRLLLAAKASTSDRMANGFTPLLIAASRGHKKNVELLLEQGDFLDAYSDKGPALLWASQAGHSEVAQLLRDAKIVSDIIFTIKEQLTKISYGAGNQSFDKGDAQHALEEFLNIKKNLQGIVEQCLRLIKKSKETNDIYRKNIIELCNTLLTLSATNSIVELNEIYNYVKSSSPQLTPLSNGSDRREASDVDAKKSSSENWMLDRELLSKTASDTLCARIVCLLNRSMPLDYSMRLSLRYSFEELHKRYGKPDLKLIPYLNLAIKRNAEMGLLPLLQEYLEDQICSPMLYLGKGNSFPLQMLTEFGKCVPEGKEKSKTAAGHETFSVEGVKQSFQERMDQIFLEGSSIDDTLTELAKLKVEIQTSSTWSKARLPFSMARFNVDPVKKAKEELDARMTGYCDRLKHCKAQAAPELSLLR